MGKVKKAKKFRQNHLKDKVKQNQVERKHSKLLNRKPGSKPTSRKANGSNGKTTSDEVSFDAPAEEFAFEKYLSEGSDAEGEANSGSEDEELDEEVEVLDSEEEELENEEITLDTVKEWKQQLKKSPKVMKLIIRALRVESTDAEAVTRLLNLALIDVPQALHRFFPDPNSKRLSKDFGGTLKIYCTELASQVRDNASSKVVAAVKLSLPYFRSYRKLLKDLVKAMVGIVASSQAGVDDYLKLEICSILRAADEPELVLKLAYESLVRLAGRTNLHTLQDVNLAKNFFVSMYSDYSGSYSIAFQQLRVLALHLKSALDKNKNPDYDTKIIYTWSYVQMLDFWSRAVSVCENLRPLLHPLVQVTLRAATLIPSAQFLPLRFYLIRSLIRISQNTGVYIPVMAPLLEALNMSAISRRGKPSTLQKIDFSSILHVPANYIGTRVYQEIAGDELIDILTEALVLYSKSISFPELAAPIVVSVKRTAKQKLSDNNPKLAKQLGSWCDHVQANSAYITRSRANVNFGPRDKDQVADFLKDLDWKKTPLGQIAEIRMKAREDRQKAALESVKLAGSDSDPDLDSE